jgi:hypothetical protein
LCDYGVFQDRVCLDDLLDAAGQHLPTTGSAPPRKGGMPAPAEDSERRPRRGTWADSRYRIPVDSGGARMPELPTGIDTSRPHPARTYDYFLGAL